MARIAGVDLPNNKQIHVALRAIYGVGRVRAERILERAGVDRSLRTHQLSQDEVARLRNIIEENFKVEGDLRQEIRLNVKRLVDIGCYRGLRHRSGLPVRGQSTHSNARTRKGPRKTVAGKKKVTKK